MTSFLDSILCCCFRRRPLDETADEHSALLPAPEDGPSISVYESTSIDHQKAKERLNVIVKAKEGRMVRVLSRVPFNLRNEPTNGFANASSSRSNRSPSTNVSYANPQITNNYGADTESEQFLHKYQPSPSVSRSESVSSAQQASTSRMSTEDLSDPYTEHKLKVQLVPSSKNIKRAYSLRGRSKMKQGRLGEDDGPGNLPTLEGIQSVDSGREYLAAGHPIVKASEEAEVVAGTDDVERPPVTSLPNEEAAEIKEISKELSLSLKDDFDDIGALTRSWGD